MPRITGLLRSPRNVRGDVPDLFQELGDAEALPVTLENDATVLTFAAESTYGVTLESIEDLAFDSSASPVGFTWTFAAGALWRIRVNQISDAGDDAGDDAGGGSVDLWPSSDVEVTRSTTPEGREALCFRWAEIDRPDGGMLSVTAIVSLGAGEPEARWWIGVTRDSDGDGLELVEFPRLSPIAPVAPEFMRALVPTISPPPAGAVNASLAAWDGLDALETHHPTGEAGTLSQQFQFEAIAATDLDDPDSVRRVLLFATDDRDGWHKRWSRAVGASGTDVTWEWAHRYVPRWVRYPVEGLDSASKDGSTFYAPYRVLVGPMLSPTGAWHSFAAARYRTLIDAEKGPEAPPKLIDTGRSELARGLPLIAARGRMPVDGTTAGMMIAAAADDLRGLLRAEKAAVLISDLQPALDTATPNLTGGFAKLRGSNYHIMCPTWSHNLHLGWLPMQDEGASRPVDPTDGFFHPGILDAELDAYAEVGINSLRVRGSWIAWCIDPDGYMRTLKLFCAGCAARGMGVTYTLWTTTPAGYAAFAIGTDARFLMLSQFYDMADTRALLWTLSETWQTWAVTGTNGAPKGMPAGEVDLSHWPEPLSGAGWDELGRFGQWSDTTAQGLARDYMVAIARFFATDADGIAAYHSTDLYNEPGVAKTGFAVGDARREQVRQNVNDFIAQSYRIMKEEHPDMQAVISGADGDDEIALHRAGVTISYRSGHAYNFIRQGQSGHDERYAAIAQSIEDGVAEAAAVGGVGPAANGLPFVVDEFYVRPENSGEMQTGYLDPLIANGAGGQSWSHLKNAAWRYESSPGAGARPFDGLKQCSVRPLNVTTGTISSLTYPVIEVADDAAIRAWVLTP